MSDTVAADPIACWDTLLAQAAHVLHHPSEAGFAPRLEALADAIFAALARDPDAGVFALLHGEDAAGYAVTHALRTALVSALVAERCGWSPSARRTLVRAGLTMNTATPKCASSMPYQLPGCCAAVLALRSCPS